MGDGGVFDEPEEGPVSPERPRQRPMEVDRNRYYETGALMMGVGGDGMPVVGGSLPGDPEEGLNDDNLICSGAGPRVKRREEETWLRRAVTWLLGLLTFGWYSRRHRRRREKETRGRPPCEHYVAIILRADGVAKGFGTMKQIRRFCKRLSTASELFEVDIDIYACTSRCPQDKTSAATIDDFESRQKAITEETAETSGTLDF